MLFLSFRNPLLLAALCPTHQLYFSSWDLMRFLLLCSVCIFYDAHMAFFMHFCMNQYNSISLPEWNILHWGQGIQKNTAEVGNNGGKKATQGPSGFVCFKSVSKLKDKYHGGTLNWYEEQTAILSYIIRLWKLQHILPLKHKYCIVNLDVLTLLNTGEKGGLQFWEMICQTKAISQINHTSETSKSHLHTARTDRHCGNKNIYWSVAIFKVNFHISAFFHLSNNRENSKYYLWQLAMKDTFVTGKEK